MKKIDAQINVTKAEFNSMAKYKLTKNYNVPYERLDVDFVEKYCDKKLKANYMNLCQIFSNAENLSESCINKIEKDFLRYKDNALFKNSNSIDIIQKYKGFNHYIINKLMNALHPNFSISSAFDGGFYIGQEMNDNFSEFIRNNRIDWKFVMNRFGLSLKAVPKNFKEYIGCIKSLVKYYYGFEIRHDKNYKHIEIRPSPNFHYNIGDEETDNKDKLPEILIEF
jgi:hypothetical protein